ncbi:MAG TPA: AMP-binding protein [Bacteroidaceae bacterium]|jgi:acetyl-CoA synthetase|nr:AMP-binding protein [Bacteroidaceae bacterium]MBP8602756.1 AMP-binding protein [Bacteroidaceae bacterium]HOD67994.1 AMP-binding protein [Bacteroidaceae bacterium]HQL25499.1 AMP-binding protein [Bacteroidaceae bacterium]
MLEKYLQKVNFDSLDDFRTNFKIKVPDNFNFGYDVVDEWARNAPHKLALLWTNDKGEEHRYTFADMKRMSDRVASFYLSLGIEKGDKVMMMLKRRIEFWFSIIALHKIGAVAIPATHLLTAKDIIYRSNAADIKMIVCADEPEILRHVEEALPDSPTVSLTVATGSYKEGCWLSLDEGISGAAPFVRPQHVNENRDMSLLYFTSGSSGNPKMAAHNYLYPLGHIVTAKYWHNLNENSLHLTIADTGWGKAVWGKLYGQWLSGAAVFVYDHEKFIPADILAVMAKYRITSFCAPPTIYRYLIREDFSKYDLSALEYCTTAGEPLNPSVFECWKQLTGLIIHEGFGQTETTMTIGTFPWMEPKPGSLGVPNPAYDMDLLSQDGRSAEDGENGEIIIRTDKRLPVGLFEEYYRDAELTKAVHSDGIYHTGDVAWRDSDGYYWFVGRTDDVIKSSGYRIGPFEVESALMTHAAVVECAVTGVPDEVRGQIIKATVILSKEYRDCPDKEALIKEIQNHVKKVSAPYKYPRLIEFVDELPKTISGKIRRVEIRDRDSAKQTEK